jgi:methylated-DNA-protein-cysteine methyltransferase related protein
MVASSQFDSAIWHVVSNIPHGCVMSYGEVARAAGYPRHARMVSKAMSRSRLPLPWHRVLRSDGRIAFAIGSDVYEIQKNLLQREGLLIVDGKVSQGRETSKARLDRLLWCQDQ